MYELCIRVRFSEVGADARLTEVHLLNYLQDCATMHSEDVGYGMQWLFDNHCGWFVVSWQLEIYRLPMMGERINVKTYPIKIKGFFGFRDFVVLDEAGEKVAVAHSEWVLMDTLNLKPIRVTDDMVSQYGIDEPPTDIIWEKSKLHLAENGQEKTVITVDASKVDYNGHMNNAYFLQMASLVLPKDYRYEKLRIDYKKQIKEGEKVHIRLSQLESGYQTELVGDDSSVYAIIITK